VAIKDGQPMQTELVTIQKGQQTVVRVRLELNRAPPARAPGPLLGHTGPVWSVAISPDGKRIVSGSQDGTARVWDAATGQEVVRFNGHTLCVYAVAVSPDGSRVLSGSGWPGDGTPSSAKQWRLCLWDLATGKELQRLEGPVDVVTSVAFSADGRRALIGKYSGEIILWDVAAWREIKRLATTPRLWCAQFSPDGRQAVAGSGHGIDEGVEHPGSLSLFDLSSGSEPTHFAGHRQGVWRAVFSPTGQQIATAGGDGMIRLWNAGTGALVHEFDLSDVSTSIAYAPSGRRLLTGNYGTGTTVRLWNLETMREMASFGGHTSGVQAVAISRDGRWAASGSHDCAVRLWELPAEVRLDSR
jgi:WD40 repeat protein